MHALPLASNEKTAMLGGWKSGADCSVPDDKAQEYYKFTVDILDIYGLDYVIYGHIGNSHYHVNLFAGDEELIKKTKEAYAIVVKRAVELGGSISAEHGVGKIKKPYLEFLYPEFVLDNMKEIKLVFDRNNLTNKGNMLTFD